MDATVEELQCGNRLVEGYQVARLVNAGEGKVAVLTHFAIFNAVDDKRGVAGGSEFGGVGVVQGKGNCFTSEPVT